MRCKSYSADFSNLWTYFTGQIYWLPKEAACPWRRLNKVSHFLQEKKSYFNLHSIELHTIRHDYITVLLVLLLQTYHLIMSLYQHLSLYVTNFMSFKNFYKAQQQKADDLFLYTFLSFHQFLLVIPYLASHNAFQKTLAQHTSSLELISIVDVSKVAGVCSRAPDTLTRIICLSRLRLRLCFCPPRVPGDGVAGS